MKLVHIAEARHTYALELRAELLELLELVALLVAVAPLHGNKPDKSLSVELKV